MELMPNRKRPTRVDTHATQSSGKPELPNRGEATKLTRLVGRLTSTDQGSKTCLNGPRGADRVEERETAEGCPKPRPEREKTEQTGPGRHGRRTKRPGQTQQTAERLG